MSARVDPVSEVLTDSMRFLLCRLAGGGCVVERRSYETGAAVVGVVNGQKRDVQRTRMVTVFALYSRGLVSRKDIPAGDFYDKRMPIVYSITAKGRKVAFK